MSEERKKIEPFSLLVVGLLSFIFTFPLFFLIDQFVPSVLLPFGDGIRIDQIILYLLLFVVLFLIIRKFKTLFISLSVIGLATLTVLNFVGVYPLNAVYSDYQNLLYNLHKNSLEINFLSKNKNFIREENLRDAINYNDEAVLDFSRNIATKHFQEFATLSNDKRWVQYFSIFKEIKSNWIYVYDPLEEEYFSNASNTIELLRFNGKFKGDCDDYSILMAACVRAVGGEVRLIRTEVMQPDGSTIGHLYPEVKIGDKKELESVAYLLKSVLFPKEIKDNPIRYYHDPKGFIWLNFDYNDNYPGGRYQSDVRISEMKV
mgnify:CR=1 FL=1